MILTVYHIPSPNFTFLFVHSTIAAGCFYLQTTFGDDMKKNSDYWQEFHSKKN